MEDENGEMEGAGGKMDRGEFGNVGGVLWQMGDVDGEDLKLEVTIMDKDYRKRMREDATEEAVPRKMFIRKQDVEERLHGEVPRVCVDFEGN